MADKDVWQLLLTKEYIDEAELLVSAAIGADVQPDVLTEELQRSSDKLVLVEDDAAAIADRLVRLVAAVTALSRYGLEQLAATVEWSKIPEEDEPDAEAVRNTMLNLLNQYADGLREQLDD